MNKYKSNRFLPIRLQWRLTGLMFSLSVAAIYPAADLVAQTPGGVASPVQSTATPMGLNIVGPVMAAGSDKAAANFQTVLPGMQQFISTYLPEYQTT